MGLKIWCQVGVLEYDFQNSIYTVSHWPILPRFMTFFYINKVLHRHKNNRWEILFPIPGENKGKQIEYANQSYQATINKPQPTKQPTNQPTNLPTYQPSNQPTKLASKADYDFPRILM